MCVLLCIFQHLETQDRRLKNPFLFSHITDRQTHHQHKVIKKTQLGLTHNSTNVTLTRNALKWPNPNTWTIKNNAYLIWHETTSAKMRLKSCRRNIWQPSPVSARLMQNTDNIRGLRQHRMTLKSFRRDDSVIITAHTESRSTDNCQTDRNTQGNRGLRH